MGPRTKFVLPEGYTWTKFGQPMHKVAWQKAESLMAEAIKRDPDVQGVCVYNDYLGYAILDLVQGVLNSVYWKCSRKCSEEQWLECWNMLAGLSIFIPEYPDFMNVDDGDQVRATDAVYGALVVKVLKAMAPQFEEKGEAGFPDLEYTLRAMADMGETTSGFDGGEYTHIIKDYARHLFGPQSREEREARAEKIKQAYQAFYKKLPRDQKEEYADRSGVEAKSTDEDDDDMEVDDASASVPWFGEWKPQDANYKIKNFPLNGVWKKYREFISDQVDLSRGQKLLAGKYDWDLTGLSTNATK